MLERDQGWKAAIETHALCFSRSGRTVPCALGTQLWRSNKLCRRQSSWLFFLTASRRHHKTKYHTSTLKNFIKRCRLNKRFYCTTEYVNTECETETESRKFTILLSLRGRRRILKDVVRLLQEHLNWYCVFYIFLYYRLTIFSFTNIPSSG